MEDVEEDVEVEELPKLILIEDLGMLYPTENSNYKARIGIYECGFCGKHFRTHTYSVKSGKIKSCGCYNRSQSSKAHKTHGGSYSKIYYIWKSVKDRTTNIKRKDYLDYGGRGIKVCDEWLNDFNIFQQWSLDNGYEEGKRLSIDRIDNDGNYEPSNCRWTTKTIQSRNQRMKSNNTSGYRGVCLVKTTGNFRVIIMVDNILVRLGYFKTAIEGAIAYNNYIIENNLEGFILNPIPEEFKDVIPERITRKKKEKND